MTQPESRVRRARPADVADIDALVRELAAYEREPDAAEATADDFATALFGSDPRVHAHVAEVRMDGSWQVVGTALWYVTFSTWKGRHGIWLEDLFVRPEHRGLGLGRELLGALAAQCVENGWPRLEWWVLDWNSPAHGFYSSLGARPEDEWTVWRLDGESLAAAGSRPPAGRGRRDGPDQVDAAGPGGPG